MSFFVNRKDCKVIQRKGYYSFKLLSKENGCMSDCCTGINVYTTTEYLTPSIHKDQEGFVVLEGTGWAKVGSEEFKIEPEVSFLAPAGITHCIKKDNNTKLLKVFWFHAAI